jgi:ribonuclease-3 family protein
VSDIQKIDAAPCGLHGSHEGEGDMLCGGCAPDDVVVDKEKTLRMHATVLAYIGDAVYEVYIRKYVIDAGYVHANRLHTAAVKFVRASAQAKVMKLIFDGLPGEEQTLARRARNKKPKTVPKNSDVIDYKWATAFEALLGYYYLTGQNTRLENAILIAINSAEGAI